LGALYVSNKRHLNQKGKIKDFTLYLYDSIGKDLGPIGLELDYEQIKMTRPKIAEIISKIK
jgi:hypothetical protein